MFIAIIQARMGSSRLPQKVLMELGGTASILHTVRRAQAAKLLEHVIVATTDDTSDNTLAEFLAKENVDCFRGDENDVLKRYYDCFQNFPRKQEVQGIVRITGDCPLIEPAIIDRVLQYYLDNNLEYCGTNETFAEGLDTEVFAPKVLKETHRQAKLLSEREHVALYIHNNKQKFRYDKISNPTQDGHIRITLDEDADYQVLKTIFEKLPEQERHIEQIKKFLAENQNIAQINSSIVRNEGLEKSLANDGEVK